ncbi:hypothetical protein BCR43DRAFT_496772 [Syncephalastrum racemosum]|uniref:Uncharacterized protein n=1 Tax=Syncephalastrum racemosum TaxID=13706 RepID=A0A1X2H4N7_SYNRA|nr:hypothetical protein BCR43DRAFT_496772 [Syncephalastrum racemosum]
MRGFNCKRIPFELATIQVGFELRESKFGNVFTLLQQRRKKRMGHSDRSRDERRHSHRRYDRDRSISTERQRDRSPTRRHKTTSSSSRTSHRDDRDYKSRGRSRSPSRRHSKRARSVSSDSSSTSSSEEEEHRRKRHKHKKDKKKKKSKKKKSKKKVGDEWGKYGIIHEADIFTKEAEFQAWLTELKRIDVELLPKHRRKELFIDFMDDYNTATMPHEKYYNLGRWEARQEAIRMGEKVPEKVKGYDYKDDEEKLRQHHRQKAAKAAAAASQANTPTMTKIELEELAKVNRERVEADRLRRLGLTPRESMGVRYEYQEE